MGTQSGMPSSSLGTIRASTRLSMMLARSSLPMSLLLRSVLGFTIHCKWLLASSPSSLHCPSLKRLQKFEVELMIIYSIYLNYATKDQDSISSYGAVNVQKLKVAAKKYDPEQVFQKLVPGGFKLPNGGGDGEMHHGGH